MSLKSFVRSGSGCATTSVRVPQTTLEHVGSLLLLKRPWLFLFSAYDVKGYLGQAERLTAPEEVIAAGCGVCCGYSNLCTEMCR